MCSGFASAESPGERVRIEDAWARATPPGSESAAIYLTIFNESEYDVEIRTISASVAAMAHIHKTSTRDGMMAMNSVDAFGLKAGDSRTFEPGGLHIMLTGLQQSLVEGMTFNLEISLNIKTRGAKMRDVKVRKTGMIRVPVPVKVGSITQVSAP